MSNHRNPAYSLRNLSQLVITEFVYPKYSEKMILFKFGDPRLISSEFAGNNLLQPIEIIWSLIL